MFVKLSHNVHKQNALYITWPMSQKPLYNRPKNVAVLTVLKTFDVQYC